MLELKQTTAPRQAERSLRSYRGDLQQELFVNYQQPPNAESGRYVLHIFRVVRATFTEGPIYALRKYLPAPGHVSKIIDLPTFSALAHRHSSWSYCSLYGVSVKLGKVYRDPVTVFRI